MLHVIIYSIVVFIISCIFGYYKGYIIGKIENLIIFLILPIIGTHIVISGVNYMFGPSLISDTLIYYLYVGHIITISLGIAFDVNYIFEMYKNKNEYPNTIDYSFRFLYNFICIIIHIMVLCNWNVKIKCMNNFIKQYQ